MADTITSPLLHQLITKLDNIIHSNDTNNAQILTEIHGAISTVTALAQTTENRLVQTPVTNSWLTQVKLSAYQFDDFLDLYLSQVNSKFRVSLCNKFRLKKYNIRDQGNSNLKVVLNEFKQHFLAGVKLPIMETATTATIRGKEVVLDEEVEEQGESEGLNRLNYKRLPSHLKQCLWYCSIFPKGYRINREKLIMLWMAEGFVIESDDKSLDDIGNEYFMELLRRSFFVELSKNCNGDVVECHVNDLVYDDGKSGASVECSVENGVSSNLSTGVRYSSLFFTSEVYVVPEKLLSKAMKLRTLVLLSGKLENVSVVLQRFNCLRVLDLSRSGLRELPTSVGTLRHLRYLDLSCTYIEMLPEAIGNLKLLQALGLTECYNLRELTKAICELVNLRVLDIRACCCLTFLPAGIGKLQLLHKLPAFILGKDGSGSKLSELSGLPLKGRLEIKNLECVKNVQDCLDAMLQEKQSIRSLELSWGHYVNVANDMSHRVLESLRPSSGLSSLDIIGYKDSKFASWIASHGLPNLVKLSLTNCSCRQLPPLGRMLHLESLYVKRLSEVSVIGSEFYGEDFSGSRGFPSLKQLELYSMPKLEEWKGFQLNETDRKEAFPCLETLIIKDCSRLTHLPVISNLKNLALWNTNQLLLESLPRLKKLSSLVINEFRESNLSHERVWKIRATLLSVRRIVINDSDNFINLMEDCLRSFSSLENLSILYCDRLTSLPVALKDLASLKKLEIVECKNLVHFPDVMLHLHSLEELVIEGCPLLKSLPERMPNRTSPQELEISEVLS